MTNAKFAAYDAYKAYSEGNPEVAGYVDIDAFNEAEYGVWFKVAAAVAPWYTAPQVKEVTEAPVQSEAA